MGLKKTDSKAKRGQKDYLNMTHSILVNHLKTETKKIPTKLKLYKITDFLLKRAWTFFYYYVVNRFGAKHPYNGYSKTITGIYPISDKKPVTIALAADWATDTTESTTVATEMGKHDPDYTIHLGDTYYVGAPHEIAINFTNKNAPWIRGKKGSFAVLGNHEMYARGIAFFKKLLPTLGLKDATGKYTGQHAGYFCLENEHWRILGLDTGYHSIGKIPLVEMVSWMAPDCHFDATLIEWLEKVVKINDPEDKRGLVILTHHQYITAFKKQGEYLVPATQLAKLIGKEKEVIWLWGHEHKFSMFGKAQVNEGVTAYGRCIGNGGMPVEVGVEFERNKDKHGYSKLVLVDERIRPGDAANQLGFNGYAVMVIEHEHLEISYHDVNAKLITESWKADILKGTIKGSVKIFSSTLKTERNRPWKDLVKD